MSAAARPRVSRVDDANDQSTQEAVVSPVAPAEEARVDGCPPDAVTVNSNVVRDEVFGSNQASLAS